VRQPPGRCAYADVYAAAAQKLRLDTIDLSTGLVTGRAESVGLFVLPSSYDAKSADPVFESYRKYVNGDFQTGVFSMVSSSPLEVVGHLTRRALGLRRGVA
jgi:hypothetical protein